ncbi:hypothetical protein PanWU01x14_071950 [Parasponia andersonii]|uniref:Uncharacterized protein n=1 Tax=Parasponia andersonii TaxID=3476 RepID=A0A2P5DER0_PARAD|nr:hypothetical protein PanWU01x14_071950 [Parasponia andersonii]
MTLLVLLFHWDWDWSLPGLIMKFVQHKSIRRSLRLLSNQIFWIGGARILSGAFGVRRCGIYPYLEMVIEFVGDEIRKTSN